MLYNTLQLFVLNTNFTGPLNWQLEIARFLAGWSYAPGKKSVENKTSPHLFGWDSLSDETREYDREAVRNISRLVQMSGRRICRIAG